jgi:hypothetical protein
MSSSLFSLPLKANALVDVFLSMLRVSRKCIADDVHFVHGSEMARVRAGGEFRCEQTSALFYIKYFILSEGVELS